MAEPWEHVGPLDKRSIYCSNDKQQYVDKSLCWEPTSTVLFAVASAHSFLSPFMIFMHSKLSGKETMSKRMAERFGYFFWSEIDALRALNVTKRTDQNVRNECSEL